MKMNKPRVLISIPNMGWIHKHVCFVADMLLQDRRVDSTIIRPTANPYENNMNQVVRQAVRDEYDYLLSIDNDNPPTRNPIDLIFLDLDVVGLPTPVFHFAGESDERPFYINGYDWDEQRRGFVEHADKVGLQQVDAVGSGCIIVSRRVMLRVKQPWLRRYDDDGVVEMGGDMSFCRKATAAGFKVWMHYDYPCRHFKENDVLETIHAFGGISHGIK